MKRLGAILLFMFTLSVCFALQVGDTFRMGKDTDNTSLTWYVLDVEENRALVISQYLLCEERAYNESNTYAKWSNCSLREWLNTTFYETAFSDEERSVILETKVNNTRGFWYWRVDHDTTDHIFLLSKWEAAEYFPTEESRIAYFRNDESGSEWWVRTPGFYWGYACTIGWKGKIEQGILSSTEVSYTEGVRPVMWISF